MSDWKLCYGCMEPLTGTDVCPHCGYDRNTVSLSNYIKPGSVLHERFLVGRMLSANGEGVTYVGFDTSVECKILIREYFPERLCSRVPNSSVINVGYEHLAQYKALMAEYTEMNKALARLRNLSHLNPALDMFAENNTTYAVFEYLEGRTLLEYLKENAGELNWNIVRRIFPPLFTTLSLLHNAGVLHRGLSPETIFVTDKGEIKLTGFCISAVRTNDTELDAELFDGYAAPEQYFADRQQGTWTDVYGICAVLYRILTGCRATDAISRQDYDILVPPNELNPKVPENVSEGIMKGLLLDSNARVRTVTDLVTLLFEETAPETAENAADPFAAPRPKKDATAVFKPQNHHNTVPVSPHEDVHTQRRSGQQQTAHGQQGQSRRSGSAQGGQRSANGQRRPAQGGQRRPAQGGSQGGQRRPAQGGQRSGNGQPVRRRPAAAAASAGSRSRQRESEITVFERIRAPLAIGILFFAIVAVVIWAFIRVWGLGAGNSLLDNGRDKDSSASDNVVPVQTDEEGRERTPDGEIPDLIGKSYSVKYDEMSETGWLILDAEFVFSDVYPKDIIYWQEFDPGTEFVSGSSMKVKVSLGSSILTIPAFKGLKLNTYLKKLEKMGLVKATDGGGNNNIAPGGQGGFAYSYGNGQGYKVNDNNSSEESSEPETENDKHQVVKYIATINYEYTNGYVCGVEPEVGKIIDAKDDYEIIVYYAYNPVVYTGTLMSSESSSSSSATTQSGKVSSTTITTKTTTKTEEPPVVSDPPKTDAPTPPPQTDAPTPPPPPDNPTPPPDNPEPQPQPQPEPGGGEEA